MITIPQKDTKKFSQPNYGDTQGNLWGTFGVNLTKNTGRVRVSRCESVYSDMEDGNNIGTPTAFAFYDVSGTGTVFVSYANKILVGGASPIDTSWAVDTNTDSPISGNGDLAVFNGRLYASEDDKLKVLNVLTSDWEDVTTLTTGGLHQLCVYEGRLYFVDDNQILSINTTGTVSTTTYTLDLSVLASGGHISWIEAGSNRIWIGITKNDGSRGTIYEWDGVTENTPSKPYYLEAQGSAGCAIWNDIPYVMDVEGRLIAFNGSNFQEVARLPLMQYDVTDLGYTTTSGTKICHFNGIQYINDAILINVGNETSGGTQGTLENYPSGIYEYTKENGLTHKYSPSLTLIDGNTLDYGQNTILSPGAIFDASITETTKLHNYASVMFGFAGYDSTGSNDLVSINVDIIEDRPTDPDHKRLGYIITPFLESTRVTDVWQKIYIKYRKFLDDTANITVKYRTTKDVPTVVSAAVWNSSTSFTKNDASIANYAVGDEVEVLTGNGGGDIAKITQITLSGSDYTVILDQAIIGVSALDVSDIRLQKWRELPVITDANTQFKELSIPQYNKDTEIQFKIILNWTDKENELREVLVVNETEQYAK